MAVLTPRSVFRRYNVDGVPSSGHHKVIKDEVVQLLEQIFGVSRGGWVVTQTLAELNGVTPESETDGGVVLDDPDPANNGYYQRDGGAWVRGRGFPDTFARVALSGSGSAQTGVVETGVNPADVEVFFAFVETDNTGPLTLAIGGEAPREVVNLAGNSLSAGEWTGVVMFALRDGKYQLLLDAGAAQAAAQSASDAADQKSYAEEWAQSDDPISVEAGGDGSTDRSAKYWAGQAGEIAVPDGSITEAKLADEAVTEAKLADGVVTEPKLAATFKGKLIVLATDRAALAAIDASAYQAAELTEGGRSGLFLWDGSDLSAEVTADPLQGLYIAPASDATGASGAWVRDYAGALNVCWFGAVGDGATDDSAAVQAAFDMGRSVFFPPNRSYEIKNIHIDGPTFQPLQHSGRHVYAMGATLQQREAGIRTGEPMFIIAENANVNTLHFQASAITVLSGGGHIFEVRGTLNHSIIDVVCVSQLATNRSIVRSFNFPFFFNKIYGLFWSITDSHTVAAIDIIGTDNQVSANEFHIVRPELSGSVHYMRMRNNYTSGIRNYGNIINLHNPEKCDGGVLLLSGYENTVIGKMHTFDNGTITNHPIQLGSGSVPSVNTKIRDYQRNGGTLSTGIKDIMCTNTDFVFVECPASVNSGNPVIIDCNGQPDCKIIAKRNTTLQNTGGTGFKEW